MAITGLLHAARAAQRLEARSIARGGANQAGALIRPVRDLETQEHAQDHDRQLDQDRGPLLLLQVVHDTTQDHPGPR
ncbi:MAG: hypothetical protein OEY13_16160 [Gammaproteobacteria bacterium]|nr:hypothetical protein [Gammaproteobacteria bacterium]